MTLYTCRAEIVSATLFYGAGHLSNLFLRMDTNNDQRCGMGVPPLVHYPRPEPLARMTLYLTDKNTLGDLFGAAWLTIPLEIQVETLKKRESH